MKSRIPLLICCLATFILPTTAFFKLTSPVLANPMVGDRKNEIWLDLPTTDQMAIHIGEEFGFTTDLDCDSQPDDLCFSLLIEIEQDGPQKDAALEKFLSEGCEETWGSP